MMSWELVLRVGPREGGGGGWAASVDSVLCCVIKKWADRLKKILMTWGGEKKLLLWCILCRVSLLCAYYYSLQHLITHYTLELSGTLRTEPCITPWNVPLRPTL
jgi:hypothetical protein